ncbi:MAG TPA: 8-amino-7-oxononanoate synthase [Planctomycetaceae bacterium]
MNTAASRLPWLADALAAIARDGLRRPRREARRLGNGRIEIGGRTLVDFASNDYLGLANDPEVVAAAREALAGGVGSGASALVSGRTPHHAALEAVLAAFEGQEDAILFPTGYAANVGTVAALAGPGDVIFCDRLNHSCLVDGCRLSGASFRVYRADRLAQLERHLAAAAGSGRRWIVTDGVFGMDGVVAPLAGLCDLADRYDAALIVDEAHGTGVLGDRGRGACERCGVEDRVAVRTGTLSKAVGALGGFVAGPRELTEYLWHRSKTQMFSTALPPAVCAAAAAAVRLIESQPDRRERLARLADRLRGRLRSSDLDVPGDAGVPIVPVILGEPERAVAAGAELERRGFAVAVIRPPTVPRGTARLRISLSAAHNEGTVDALADHVVDICGR